MAPIVRQARPRLKGKQPTVSSQESESVGKRHGDGLPGGGRSHREQHIELSAPSRRPFLVLVDDIGKHPQVEQVSRERAEGNLERAFVDVNLTVTLTASGQSMLNFIVCVSSSQVPVIRLRIDGPYAGMHPTH